MRIRTLGRSGLRVSELCLGTMTFGTPGWGCDETESLDLVDRFLDAGGNFIDTADALCRRRSRRRSAARRLRGRRHRVRARDEMHDAGRAPAPTPVARHASTSAKRATRACGGSASTTSTSTRCTARTSGRRSRRPSMRSTSWSEPARCSTSGVRTIAPTGSMKAARAVATATARRASSRSSRSTTCWCAPSSASTSPRARGPRPRLITWSPLAAGMLTGKVTRDHKPPESRLATREMPFYKLYFTERAHRIVDVLRDCARDAGCTPAQLAIAWQLDETRGHLRDPGRALGRPARRHDGSRRDVYPAGGALPAWRRRPRSRPSTRTRSST